jgi:hypothetical protein
MASHFPMSLEIYDAILVAKMDINHNAKTKWRSQTWKQPKN